MKTLITLLTGLGLCFGAVAQTGGGTSGTGNGPTTGKRMNKTDKNSKKSGDSKKSENKKTIVKR